MTLIICQSVTGRWQQKVHNGLKLLGWVIKRSLTAVFSASLVRDFLLPQTIYAGKTPCCLPTTKFPKDWDITFTQNHWVNEKTTEAHILKALATYIETCRKKLSLPTDHAAIVMFDRFTGQCSSLYCQCLPVVTLTWLLYHLTIQTAFSHLMLLSIKP